MGAPTPCPWKFCDHHNLFVSHRPIEIGSITNEAAQTYSSWLASLFVVSWAVGTNKKGNWNPASLVHVDQCVPAYFPTAKFCSPSLIWRIWPHKKLSYFVNVLFGIIWHLGLKCRIIEGFPKKKGSISMWTCCSVHTPKIRKYERTFLSKKCVHDVIWFGAWK